MVFYRGNERMTDGVACIQPGEHIVIAQLRPAWRHYLRFFVIPLITLPFLGDFSMAVFSLAVTGVLVAYSRFSNCYTITTQRVIQQSGMIAKDTAQSCISDIQLIETRANIFDRILGTGNIIMESAAHSPTGDVVFGGILDPVKVKELLFRLKYRKGRRRKRHFRTIRR